MPYITVNTPDERTVGDVVIAILGSPAEATSAKGYIYSYALANPVDGGSSIRLFQNELMCVDYHGGGPGDKVTLLVVSKRGGFPEYRLVGVEPHKKG